MANIYDVSIDNIPTIFQFMDVKTLFMAQETCVTWRSKRMLVDVHPIRRRLLDSLQLLSRSDAFRESRMLYLVLYTPLDSDAVVETLAQALGGPIPLALEIWIREWPAQAVFDCLSPGPPRMHERMNWSHPWYRFNLLTNPQLYSIALIDYVQRISDNVPAMPIWEDSANHTYLWLVMDPQHSMRGQVVKAKCLLVSYAHQCPR